MLLDTDKLKIKYKKYSPEVLEIKRRVALENMEKAKKEGKWGKGRGTSRPKIVLFRENIEKELRDNFINSILPYFPDITYEMIRQAMGGDTKMMQYIMSQLIDRPKERVEQTGNIEGLKEIEAGIRELVKRKEEQ